MKQIVLVKGWEGFADRLQGLSHCIHYCLKNDAAICVDWRDYMWGQEIYDFHDYFKISHIDVVSLKEVLEYVKSGAKVVPPAYTEKTIAMPPNETIHFSDFDSPLTLEREKIEGDIIVHNSKGKRMWHLDNLIRNISLNTSVKDRIIETLNNVKLPFTLVHLRGTDRLTTTVIESAAEKFRALPVHEKSRVYVISDTKELLETWVRDFPSSKILNLDSSILRLPNTSQGTHMLSSEVLQYYNISKHELNINTIQDFITYAFSSWSVGHSTSVFTSLAQFIGKGGKYGIANWLDGFIPETAPLQSKI